MQSIKKNTLYLMFSQLVGYVFPLLTLPYLSHVFTPAQFGIMGVCQAITQYFIIVTDYGFNITAYQSGAKIKTKFHRFFSTPFSPNLSCYLFV